MPTGLVRETYDHYAPTFEQELVGALRYQGPALLHQAVLSALGAEAGGFDILDGGCGTGLCGKVFRPMARRLAGVDASAEMIGFADEKDLYDELIHGELCESLGRYRAAFDIVLAGDVLIYLGRPDPVMSAVWAALKPGGLFALTTERLDGTGLDLSATGRYRHSDSCIEEAAPSAGFSVASVDRACLRFERGVAVESSVFVLAKPDPDRS
jgi:predicted TPR repeat methyltransferase